MSPAVLELVFFSVTVIPFTCGESFLGGAKTGLHTVRLEDRAEDLGLAAGSLIGCGAEFSQEKYDSIERAVLPIWHVSPKNKDGRVEWRMLRYIAHRYFIQQSSILVRGLEPSRLVNSSHSGMAAILSEEVPTFVSRLAGGAQPQNGFDLKDVVEMIAIIEQLMHNADSRTLDTFLDDTLLDDSPWSRSKLVEVIQEYVLHWLFDDIEPWRIRRAMQNSTMLHFLMPRWNDTKDFVNGIVNNKLYEMQRENARATWLDSYTMQDAHAIVGDITKTFASFWDSECQGIKEALVKLDYGDTGRVSLSDFYHANIEGEWRFGESEVYLRELGVLDETSSWHGKQVIIPNYLQGISNCIVTKPYYMLCCLNECETILNDIEESVNGSVATTDEILSIVGRIAGLSDERTRIDGRLNRQLKRIADMHAGRIPIHGRMFAQWLHFVFPQECAFPHKVGTLTDKSITEFSEAFAHPEEIQSNAADRQTEEALRARLQSVEEEQQLSQWSEDEELHADYTATHEQFQAPWQLGADWFGGRLATICGVLALVSMVYSQVNLDESGKQLTTVLGLERHAHLV